MKKYVLLCLSLLCLCNVAAIFETFNWVEPEQFKQWLTARKPMVLVDIQDKPSFAAHHFPNAIETNAFPVESDAERHRIDPAVTAAKKSGYDVVVLCPRGGGGAKRAYDYLKAQGVPEKRLFILTGGVDKWPYPTMLEATK